MVLRNYYYLTLKGNTKGCVPLHQATRSSKRARHSVPAPFPDNKQYETKSARV